MISSKPVETAALHSGDASRAVEALAEAEPYELGETNYSLTFGLYPVYLRGEAYLAARQGTAALGGMDVSDIITLGARSFHFFREMFLQTTRLWAGSLLVRPSCTRLPSAFTRGTFHA